MQRESGAPYPCVIMNTDQSDEKGTHWWSFLDLHPKKEIFLFDSFGFKVLKNSFFRTIRRHSIRYFMVLKRLERKTMKLL